MCASSRLFRLLAPPQFIQTFAINTNRQFGTGFTVPLRVPNWMLSHQTRSQNCRNQVMVFWHYWSSADVRILPLLRTKRLFKLRIGGVHQRKKPAATDGPKLFLTMGTHALLVSSAWELSRMGLLKSLATRDELLSYERQGEAPVEGEWAKTAHLDDDSDPLSAARGAVLGVALGSIIWTVILWALL